MSRYLPVLLISLILLSAIGVSAQVTTATIVGVVQDASGRSEEHTSELQSPCNLVCRLLLEKKKITTYDIRGTRLTSAPHISCQELSAPIPPLPLCRFLHSCPTLCASRRQSSRGQFHHAVPN